MYLMQDPDKTEVVNPDEIRIKRVYVRPANELAPDATVEAAQPHDIIVEWEAGPAANGYYGGVNKLTIYLVVYDINGVANLAHPTCVAIAGPWSGNTDGTSRHATYQTEWTGIAASYYAAGNPYEITAFLYGPTAGPPNPFQVSVAKCLLWAY